MSDAKSGVETQYLDPDIEQYYKDVAERVLWVEGEITESILRCVKLILQWNREDRGVDISERMPIKIFIDSEGGDLDCTMSLIETIKISKTPVYTINMGFAYSAAAILLIAGHKRYGMPNSNYMLHSGSASLGGTYEQTIAGTKLYKSLMNVIKSFVLEYTSISAKTYNQKTPTDWYLNTDEALRYGIIHEIIEDIDSII